MRQFSISEVARQIGARPKDISDLSYQRKLDDNRCPVVGGRRLIPEDYVPVVERSSAVLAGYNLQLRTKGVRDDCSIRERLLVAAQADGAVCLEHALRYLHEFGWSALAVCPPDHVGVGKTHGQHCQSPGKAPWGCWKQFQDRLPTADELQQKWHDNPTLNVGMALGPVSGLVRVDVDGPAGEARLLQLSGGIIPRTLEFTSGRNNGGRGLLYQIPPGANLRTTVERPDQPKQELRFQAKGAQTVLPPSRHPESCLYAWLPGRSPWETEAALAPDWLLIQLRPGQQGGNRHAAPAADSETIVEGHRDTELTSMAGVMRRRGFSTEAICAALLVENENRCQPPLDEAQVKKIAQSVGRYAPATGALRTERPSWVRAEVEL